MKFQFSRKHFQLAGILCIGMLLCHTNTIFAQNIEIKLDSTHQIIQGFGAANIVGWRPDMTDLEIETAFGMEEDQLGLSILRLRIAPSRNDWGANIATAKKAYEMGVTIIASPWTPPASMKTNNSLIGGSLKPESYQAYAEHLRDFADFMEENGVPIYAVSVQNEPDIEVSYESCWWTPEEMTTFMRENAASIGTKVIAPESFQFRKPISDAILNDSLAASHLDIVGGHIYGGGLSRYALAEEKGKEVWMTEHYTESANSGNLWPLAFDVATEIHNNMMANFSAYIWWYIVRYYGPIGEGEQGTVKGEITKRGYLMANYSKFIRPGFHRVEAPGTVGLNLYLSAYRGDSTVVAVVVNNNNSERDLTLNFTGGEVSYLKQYVTSATQNLEMTGYVPVENGSFTASFTGKSVTTFVSTSSMPSSVSKNREVPVGFELHQNYPNPFNPSTTIGYYLPVSSEITIEVFDVLGRKAATLVEGKMPAGQHQLLFDASHLPSGVYIYRLTSKDFTQTQKMTLIK